jgi:glucose/mannose-6-phosphate isomerase
MFDKSLLEKYDPTGMHKVYDNWPKIARDAFESQLEPFNLDNVNHIIFAGMGGSGAICDILAAILSKTKIHLDVVKGYLLPKTVTSESLVIAISVSGNTSETQSVLESANKQTNKIIGFSSGGEMEKFCLENNLEHRKIPMYHSPRASLVVFLYSILNVLSPILPIEKENVYESLDKLENLSEDIRSGNTTKNTAFNLAEKITSVPLVYYPWGLQAAAIRFKNSMSENAKTHTIIDDVIEACHNGIVSWEKPSNIQPILLEGEEDYYKTKERWNILKEFFKIKHIEFQEVFSTQGHILSKLIHLVYFFDYVSIYCAVIAKADPAPIKPIDFIKKHL